MPKLRLTKRVIDQYIIPPRPVELYDTEQRGLICKITSAGAKVFLAHYRSADGTKRKPRIGVYGQITLEQAREAARSLLAQVTLGGDPSRDRQQARRGISVGTLCDRFLAEHAEHRSKPTYLKQQRRMIDRQIKPVLGTVKAAAVTRKDVIDLHLKLRGTPYEANRVLALLRVVFNFAEGRELRNLGTNPCLHVPKYREKRRERFLTDNEVVRIFASLDDSTSEELETPPALLAIRLLFATACRAGEILGLRWSYLEMARSEIVWPDGKTGGFRKPITSEIRGLLEAADQSKSTTYVCTDTSGKGQLSLSTLSKAWARIMERAGVTHCGLHAIRHRVATDIANSGVSLQDGMKLTGHRSVQTYLRYLHAEKDRVQEAAETVSKRRRELIRVKA